MTDVDKTPVVEVSIDDIQHDLLAYLRRVENGETLVITRTGRPLAEVRPIKVSVSMLRPSGLCEGEFRVPDNFDDPLPERIIKAFEGQ